MERQRGEVESGTALEKKRKEKKESSRQAKTTFSNRKKQKRKETKTSKLKTGASNQQKRTSPFRLLPSFSKPPLPPPSPQPLIHSLPPTHTHAAQSSQPPSISSHPRQSPPSNPIPITTLHHNHHTTPHLQPPFRPNMNVRTTMFETGIVLYCIETNNNEYKEGIYDRARSNIYITVTEFHTNGIRGFSEGTQYGMTNQRNQGGRQSNDKPPLSDPPDINNTPPPPERSSTPPIIHFPTNKQKRTKKEQQHRPFPSPSPKKICIPPRTQKNKPPLLSTPCNTTHSLSDSLILRSPTHTRTRTLTLTRSSIYADH